MTDQTAGPPSKRIATPMATLRTCAVVMTVILAGFAAWALRHILEPFVLAVFLLLMVDGLAAALKSRVPNFPDRAALPLAIVLIVGLFALAIWMTVNTATDFIAQSHAYEQRINAVLDQSSQRLGLKVTPTVSDLLHKANPAHYAGVVAGVLRGVGESAVFVLIYLGFLIASRQGFQRKEAQLFPSEGERQEATRVFDRIRKGVESYIWVQTVVGVIISGISAMIMLGFGLSHVLFWTMIIFLANYIPAIGAALGVLLPPIFGLVELHALWEPVVMLALLECVHFGVSHVVQPRMQGKSLNVDPIVVLLALTFWGVIWGVTGAFLSTPLTVMAMAILAEFKGSRPIAILLSGDGKPYANAKF